MHLHRDRHQQGDQVKATEHPVKSPSTRTGCFATLLRLPGGRESGALAVALAVLAFAVLALAPAAQAAGGILLGSFASQLGEPAGHVGFGGGIVVDRAGAGGVEAGEVYVADYENARVDVFSPTGEFVRAFGWDVTAGGQDNTGADEVQAVTIPDTVTAGTFKLTLTTATGTGMLTSGSNTVQGVEHALGSLHVGDAITGTGIPSGATVTGVGSGTVTISANATSGESFDRALMATETTAPIAFAATATEVQAALEALPGVGTGNVTVSGGPGVGAPFSITFAAGPLSGNDIEQMTIANSLTGGTGTVATASNGGGYEICKAVSSPLDTCKAGDKLAKGGSINRPEGIAIDQSTGNVFVSSQGNKRIDVFSATGRFEGSFGQGVETGVAAFQFCTTATGCQAGIAGGGAGAFAEFASGMAVDPTTGDLYVADYGNHRIDQFSFILNGSAEVTGASFVRAFGWKVDAAAPEEKLQECTTASGCQAGKGEGSGAGQVTGAQSLAVSSDGTIYAVEGTAAGCNKTTFPCRVEKFIPATPGGPIQSAGTLETGSPSCQLTWTSGQSKAEAPRGIAIDPSDGNIYITRRTSTTTFQVCELSAAGALLNLLPKTGSLEASFEGNLQPAVGTGERLYLNSRIVGQRGVVYLLGPEPPASARIVSAEATGPTGAHFVGEVAAPAELDGETFDTTWHFEYSTDQKNWTKVPVPDKDVGSEPEKWVKVEESAAGLQPHTTYFVRVCASTSSPACSSSLEFTTQPQAPTILSTFAEAATQTELTLAAQINPNGLPTTYQFGWASQAEWEAHPGVYRHDAPSFRRAIGSAHEAVQVREPLTGLETGTTYHYRVVAESSKGESIGPDHEAETLDSCGLPVGRCLERVSPADLGPVARPGRLGFQSNLHFQASISDRGEIAYMIENGLPETTTGYEVLYKGTRSSDGWSSAQLSPPITAPNEVGEASSLASSTVALSDDLSCGALISAQPLTGDSAVARLREAGGVNLFRRDSVGTYRAVSNLLPENSSKANGFGGGWNEQYVVVGMSANCGKIVFASPYHYPGVGGVGEERLYEWDEGVLRDVAIVPGSGGEVPTEVVTAKAGAFGTKIHGLDLVSNDGSRVFFTAKRQSTGAEHTTGVFVREEGTSTRDLSLSRTPTPDTGAAYQWATPDGARVFFTANAGLTAAPESSKEGTDLYEYDLEDSELKDLSVDHEAGGAAVGAMFGASEDGSVVYFAARGQLLPGVGNTFTQNQSAGTYSVYERSGSGVRYVGLVRTADLERAAVAWASNWTSRVSPDGRYLLFESTANVTGYESGGAPEAYLFDDASSSEATVCVSCRQDGEPSVASTSDQPLLAAAANSTGPNSPLAPPQTLVVRGGRARVFFTSPDRLAPGSSEDLGNLYEWADGQVFRIATEPEGETHVPFVNFAGADPDGTDLYFGAPEPPAGEGGGERLAIYDARVGGGFPEPEPAPAPCSATTEGSCQHGAAASAPVSPGPASNTFSGPGNPPQPAATKHKKHKAKKHKQHHKKGKKQKKGKQSRDADRNGRAGK